MEAVMSRPKQSYVFDHKLTDEEIERITTIILTLRTTVCCTTCMIILRSR